MDTVDALRDMNGDGWGNSTWAFDTMFRGITRDGEESHRPSNKTCTPHVHRTLAKLEARSLRRTRVSNSRQSSCTRTASFRPLHDTHV